MLVAGDNEQKIQSLLITVTANFYLHMKMDFSNFVSVFYLAHGHVLNDDDAYIHGYLDEN